MEDVKFEVIRKLADTNFKVRALEMSKIDSNSPPSVFVGSKLAYPNVNVGILSPIERDENAWIYDSEKYWADNNFQIGEVLKLRQSLLNSRFQARVQDTRLNKKFVEIAKEIAVAYKPVDVEIELQKRMKVDSKRDRVLTPNGLRGSLKKAEITGNVKVHNKVEKLINDDVKASEAIFDLYKSDFDVYPLNKILSVGVLGMRKNRRLVPTRWSITATDDTVGKKLLNSVRDFKQIENYEMYVGDFLGNQYIILFFPGVWSFELFELYLPRSSWNPTEELKASTDYESFSGRKEYAFSTAGGYYATRLPILEKLFREKRQASVLAIRIETPSYWAGLGVWVVRESVRKTLLNKKMDFNSMDEIVNSSKQISKIKYSFDNSSIVQRSRLLKELKTQKTLKDWF